jgi:hypothetical protein
MQFIAQVRIRANLKPDRRGALQSPPDYTVGYAMRFGSYLVLKMHLHDATGGAGFDLLDTYDTSDGQQYLPMWMDMEAVMAVAPQGPVYPVDDEGDVTLAGYLRLSQDKGDLKVSLNTEAADPYLDDPDGFEMLVSWSALQKVVAGERAVTTVTIPGFQLGLSSDPDGMASVINRSTFR